MKSQNTYKLESKTKTCVIYLNRESIDHIIYNRSKYDSVFDLRIVTHNGMLDFILDTGYSHSYHRIIDKEQLENFLKWYYEETDSVSN